MLGQYLGAGASTTKFIFRFNGNANDSSGNSLSATPTDITYAQQNGALKQCGVFNGSSSKLAINANFIRNYAQPLSIFAIGSFTQGNTGFIFSCGCGNSSSYYGLHGYNFLYDAVTGTLRFYYGPSDGQDSSVSCPFTPEAGRKYHVAVTKGTGGPNTWNLYIDGQKQTVTKEYKSTNDLPTWRNTHVGHRYWFYSKGNPAWFNGTLDEVVFEDREVSEQYIRREYTNIKGRFGIL